jgi:phosphatidate phosphatase APP1
MDGGPANRRVEQPAGRKGDIADRLAFDPEVYAEALQRHPQQITRIYIRNITGARRDDTRFAKTFARVEAPQWVLFEDAQEIGMQ